MVILRAVMNLKICMDSYGQPAMMGYRDHNALHFYSGGVRFESPLDLSYPNFRIFFWPLPANVVTLPGLVRGR